VIQPLLPLGTPAVQAVGSVYDPLAAVFHDVSQVVALAAGAVANAIPATTNDASAPHVFSS
jgi:methylglyoxal synthase